MHAGQETDMKRGAIWACVIPVSFAILISIPVIVDTWQGATAKVVRGKQDSFDYTDITVMCFLLLLAVLLILSGPLTAWLTCRRLAKIEDAEKLSRLSTSAKYTVLNASVVNAAFAVTYGLLAFTLAAIFQGTSVGWLKAAKGLLDQFGFYLLVNVGIWVVVTLPLSFLCATIFWSSTKFPKDTLDT